ncbi:MAG: TIM barrel protein [bacterium]
MAPSKLKINEPWERAAAIAASTGFEGIEIPDESAKSAAEFNEILDQLDLRSGGCGLTTHRLRADASEFEAYLETLPGQAKMLSKLGSNRAMTWIQPFSDTLTYRENFKWHVDRLGRVASVLEQHDCILAIEFLGPVTLRQGHRYPFVHTIEQALELCEAIGPNVGLLLDAWHWHTSLATIEDLRMLNKEQVAYVHVNDAPAGVPFDQYQDQVRELPASTGVIDIGAFMAELRRMEYDGPIVAEPFDDSLAALPSEEAARRGIDAIKRMLRVEPRPALPPMMKVLAVGKRRARVIERPVPRPAGNEVVVKIHASLLCGSNMGQFFGDEEKINGGHEAAGEVVAVAQSNRLRVGDRVALAPITSCGRCRYCLQGDVLLCRQRPQFDGNFAQYTRVSDTVCVKIPGDISYEHGALLGCALGPAYGALKWLGVRAFDTLVVTGLGPVGIGVSTLAKFMNVRVIAVDPVAERRQIAEQIGVDHTHDGTGESAVEQLRELIGGDGSRFGIDCTGRPEAERLLIDLAAPNGAVVFIGENKGNLTVHPSADFIRKQLTAHGIWHMNMNDVDDLIVFLRRRPDLADLILTHRFPFDCAQEAFDTFADRRGVKVALQPWVRAEQTTGAMA